MHGVACMANLGEGVARVKVMIQPWLRGIDACVFALSCEPRRPGARASARAGFSPPEREPERRAASASTKV